MLEKMSDLSTTVLFFLITLITLFFIFANGGLSHVLMVIGVTTIFVGGSFLVESLINKLKN